MTREALTRRAAMLEELLDNSEELSLPDVEEELSQIYKLLQREFL